MSHARLSVGPARIGTADLLAVAPLVGSLVVGLLAWPALPAEMAVHFSGGEPDGFLARSVAVWTTPAIGFAGVAVVRYSDDTAGPVGDVAVGFVGWITGLAHLYLVAWNLGYRVSTLVVVVPALVGSLVVVYVARFGPWR